jgi:acetyltransferase-like isoleucine patch superfamily enzyme
VIEPSAVVLGSCDIDASAYVGHFAVLGCPVAKRGFGRSEWQVQNGDDHWSTSRGLYVGPGVTICTRVTIGDATNIGSRSFISAGVRIGNDVAIGIDVEVYYGCEISSRVKIGDRSWVGGFVCNDVVIGSEAVMFGSLIHRFVDGTVGIPEEPPIIEDGAFVGMGSMVIGGVTVGRGAYIAAGSVLTRDARPGRLYIGSPAREHGQAPSAFRDARSRELAPRQDYDIP